MPSPFDSIEGAQEYLGLLSEAAEEASATVAEDMQRATAAGASSARELDALRLVNYKLSQLRDHLSRSRRLLNDLRTLRRLILHERGPEE